MDNTSELDTSTQGETQLSSTQPPSTSASLAEKSTVPTVKRKAASRLQMKKKLRGDENLITEATKALKVISSGQSTQRQDDEDDVYGKYVANEMRSIKNIRDKQYLKIKMQELLYAAQTGSIRPVLQQSPEAVIPPRPSAPQDTTRPMAYFGATLEENPNVTAREFSSPLSDFTNLTYY